MNPMNQIPPQLLNEIRKRMAAGQGLPPGVVAVPEGMTPPPGAVHTGLSMPMGGAPQQPIAVSRATHNPLPAGEEGLKILRALSECPIPEESKKLNELLQLCIKAETDSDTIEQTLTKGLVVALRANKYCKNQTKTRTVCIFDEDEKLKELHTTLHATEKKLETLQNEMRECINTVSKTIDERWKVAVKNYGLNPDKWSYRIDEEKGLIEQVDLQCLECKGISQIRKSRQETAEMLMKLDTDKKGEQS
jgi:hypothetical protein